MTNAVHHLNCATMAPRLSLGGRLTPTRMVAHALLVEGETGLTLVDTGFGTEDLATRRMGRAFITMMGAALDPAETAVSQVRGLGFDPADVRDIVLTHLDLDHAGGIGDFPQARVHVLADELAAATARASVKEKNRYLPGQWAHGPKWVEHHVDQASGEDWLGFSSVKVVGDDVAMIPLAGHTRGHGGVVVRRPSGDWLLHAGDAYFSTGEKETPPTCPSGLSLFQSAIQMDRQARLDNQERLREVHAAHPEVTVFCAHDASEFDALAAG